MYRRRPMWVAVPLLLALITLTACSSKSNEPEVDPGWRAAIDEYVGYSPTTQKQKDILADYWVTDQELDEIHDDWLDCMALQGFENTEVLGDGRSAVSYKSGELPHLWEKVGEGGWTEQHYSDELSRLSDQCSAETWMMISNFYNGMRNNPQLVDTTPMIIKCLEEAGLLPDGSTVETLSEAVNSGLLPYETPAVGYCYENDETWTPEEIPTDS